MKGDFSRNTFNASQHFLRVLMQQGRVQLDADWNEQVAILLHYLQNLAKDLIGPHGGPSQDYGFEISTVLQGSSISDLGIGDGHYYVDGILCENEIKRDPSGVVVHTTYFTQPDYPLDPEQESLPDQSFLVYLDVWERHLTAIEFPDMREVALDGPDTASRAKVIWQVKAQELDGGTSCTNINPSWEDLVEQWQPPLRGMLKVQTQNPTGSKQNEPCTISPESRYRGPENQLYRVEVHRSGSAANNIDENRLPTDATFKWARDNGSIIFPITALAVSSGDVVASTLVTLEHFGRDARYGLAVGDWVEIVDDDYVLLQRAEPLLKVIAIDPINLQVTLEGAPQSDVGLQRSKNPILRRWDHKAGDPAKGGLELEEGAALIKEQEASKPMWLTLEDGIQIQFQFHLGNHAYRTGDYWLIPARTNSGDVQWPTEQDNRGNIQPLALPPHGIEHHFAPLAVVVGGSVSDCRCSFDRLSVCPGDERFESGTGGIASASAPMIEAAPAVQEKTVAAPKAKVKPKTRTK